MAGELEQILNNARKNISDIMEDECLKEDTHKDQVSKHSSLLRQLRKDRIEWYDVQKITNYVSKHSSTGIDIGSIRKQISGSGYFFILKDIPLRLLVIEDEEKVKSEIDTPFVAKDKPIVVGTFKGDDFYVIDGRHRAVASKMLNKGTIRGFVPFELLNNIP